MKDKLFLLNAFKKGSLATKLSFLIMGYGHLAKKQILKGLFFLATELTFIFFMITSGVQSLQGLITLGTNPQGWQFDEKLGFKVRIAGDNSTLLLIFGICTLFTIIGFLFLWRLNIKSSVKLDELSRENKHIPSLLEETKELFDGKFHLTLLTIPTISILVFTILPLVYMISIAFTSYDHNHLPPKNLFDWIGFSNFGNVLSGDIASTFFPLLSWTLVWATFATFTCFFFGVVLAVMLNAKGVIGKKVMRTLFVITMAVPPFVSLLVMKNLLHASGPINTFLINSGVISSALPFLTDGLWAKVSIIFVNMWIGIPASMLITTGVLINLPEEQLEAARIDGANPFQIFRNVTFPQILTVMAPSLIQQFVGNINNFNVIYLLTGGLPSNSNYYGAGETDLLVTWLYKLTVDNADYNLASVIGIVTFILSAVVSLLVYTRTKSYKEGSSL
ncbi:multiple sugar ABC transporter permease component [Listeria fleischmannii 1991]|jgi:arabinogalactan oligomer/maltooligosaccharide transport system permease protein|uniref:Maltose/maltodextrin transport system permease protein n=2 Tax=Listeria fleischmannii TaxID=1069827 RepID=A0A2X3HKW0_9LIST|nr:sugar ABC transporter permease [Listeria fleischmannii]EMG27310.1 sugar ABC transporter permease [Listeria fleischmannii subsp. fleischmannii LU2006-1]KMT57845.1 multiple sugar ABC transporter permease component [Listeria fleischmannii 1991]SQC71764.1 Maltose transport system permease protein malF [Listeria fleischmannii subsp. fleischmannii]